MRERERERGERESERERGERGGGRLVVCRRAHLRGTAAACADREILTH